MSHIERAIANIANKDGLHRIIDELADDDELLILCEPAKGPGSFSTYGTPTLERTLWMVEKYKAHLFDSKSCCDDCDA